jgi:hypothetical protein
MPGLVPGIHILIAIDEREDVDGRDRPGHDDRGMTRRSLRLEEIVRRFLRGALSGRSRLQAFDLRGQKRDPIVEFLDGEQRKVLPDLVGDLLSWFVVVFDRHACCSLIDKDTDRLQGRAPVANQISSIAI